MKNVFQNKGRSRGAVQMHLDPPPIQLIKSKNDAKSYKDSVNE